MANHSKPYFNPVDPHVNFPKLEQEILEYWDKNKIFEKSVNFRPESKRWNFLDGPPFVTGMPHYGSLLSSIPKDLFGRYWTMKGYHVRRVWGWDGHGLPIENKVENKLHLKRKRDIEDKIGVKKFINMCLEYVNEVSDEWKWYVDHIGRWVDFEHAYKTWDMDYMESVMWVFKGMYDKGYIYKDLRVSLYCPHCATPISNFEVAMDADNYKDLTEPANTYKYKLKGEENTYLLAWSTTPWNKLATPALAVNPKLAYVKVKQGNEFYILAKSTIKMLKDEPYEVVEEYKGADLVGREFEGHFDFSREAASFKQEDGKRLYVVIPGDFVTAEDGTGIVTIAAYGEDDLKAMKENDVQIVLHLDEEGIIKPGLGKFSGINYLEVNPLVNNDLEERGLMYSEASHTHSVPTCWRCHTRLYYAPLDAWFVDIQKLKPELKKNNKDVNWYPKHFKMGRFAKSVEAAPDWCISRNRYWGSPVPVWECSNGHRFVPGSIKELEEKSGQKIVTLHKPEIDDITVQCDQCGEQMHRVPEILDTWIEAGSASFAERHFPFNENAKLEDFFPPDFITEYTGQIRAWFYVLHVISTALYDSKAFKNVVVTGVVLGTDGRKMSKNFGNYPDPKLMIETYGGDALRLYLMGSPVMHGEDMRISEEDYRAQVRSILLILWNSYNYFVTYSNLDNWQPGEGITSDHILDKWILVLLKQLKAEFTQDLDNYNTPAAVEKLRRFINDFSTWYIRRSRDREDKTNFYATSYEVLTNLSLLIAPVAPFVSESIYRNLTKKQSVHLSDWPQTSELDKAEKDEVLQKMQYIREIVEWGHSVRKENNLKLRQPLSCLWFFADDLDQERKRYQSYENILREELNIKNIKYGIYKDIIDTEEKRKTSIDNKYIDINLTDELKSEGEAREIVRQIQDERKKLGTALDEKISVTLPDWPSEHEEYIKSKAGVANLSKGDFSVTRLQ